MPEGKGDWLMNFLLPRSCGLQLEIDFVSPEKALAAVRLLRQDEFARCRHLQAIILLLVADDDQPVVAEKVAA